MLKALVGSSWRQETLLLTYNALGKSIASYVSPVWNTNASDSSFKKIQTALNAVLRTATGSHKMTSIDHLNQESLTLKVKHHSDMFSEQSKINRSPLPPATSRWLSSYLRGRQAKTCFRGVKSSSRKVHAGVPQSSKLSPSLFSFYIADMPTPTEPVKRICYADDLTVWATGVNIPDMEDSLNSYLEEITAYLKDNSLLISAPKSSVTLFTPDTHQAKTHPRILIEDSRLPLVQCPNILGVHMDTSLSFNKHSSHVAESIRQK